jgi:hypothetical protein
MRASCGKVDPVFRAPNDALLKKKSIGCGRSTRFCDRAFGSRQAPTRSGSADVDGSRRSRNSSTPSRPAALDSQVAASSRDANSSAHMRGTSLPRIGTTTRQERPTCKT